jgi:hypothetical protein
LVKRRNDLAEVRAILADVEIPPRQRLERATRIFWWVFMFQGSDWPWHTRQTAARLLDQLMAVGRPGKTIAAMTDQTVHGLLEDMQRVVEECERP